MNENVQDDAAGEPVPGDEAPAQEAGAPLSVPVSNKRWYVVHAYSGMEKSVMRALTERVENVVSSRAMSWSKWK
jgi:transcriptional antiterminator NusG